LFSAKHVTEDFVASFSVKARSFASSLGKNNFYVVGEIAGDSLSIGMRVGNMLSDPQNPQNHDPRVPARLTRRIMDLKSTYTKESYNVFPGLTAGYGFHQSGTSRDVLLNAKASNG
jgi:hypothetical protein